ncbi:putative transmembrane protein [Rhodopirellula islandica]|uniref:Transmembrane protein n=1 Tax=Rhodopirellula islandica TaxID=595434 RepID=A0A0J1BFH2_RHOIS|nr:PVC-type heme-binding CxxCH protein [Rhodopirellula islandica]KLU05256.1 putative transmembrane protein [Rhodopirellula islandica]
MIVIRILLLVVLALPLSATAEEVTVHSFERQQLTNTYFSEGANSADINGDGVVDIVYGPHWFEGPDFTAKHEIYPPVPQNMNRYADNFFSWLHDFNGDGFNDVFVVGFPGTPAYVYENPGKDDWDKHWAKHQVFDWVSNESPQWIDIVGDEKPELICTRDGFFGFATVDWDRPFEAWEFHPISEQVAPKKFGHGLGIGDVNGDGRQDLIHSQGWFEQPLTHQLTSRWFHHPVSLSEGYGGAEMYAYDVDGDGDNDIITGHRAHDFGLAWYEQIPSSDKNEPTFKHHLIMGEHPSENKYGIAFSELHSVALADIDGDGLKDIVTGKTYWSHHRQSAQWDAGAVVYWFQLKRGKDGVEWVPFKADGEAGIGRQVSIVDVNQDQLPDIVVGGMLGAHVLTHQVKSVSEAEYKAAQPKVYTGPKLPRVEGAEALRGPKSKLDSETGQVPGAIEGETLTGEPTGGSAKAQDMSGFSADQWSNQSQLWWTGAKPADSLKLPLPEFTGTVDIEVVLTCAGDYGIVQLTLDDQPLGPPIDLYSGNVVTTGVLSFPKIAVEGKQHALNVRMVGANPKAKKAYMFALDYLRIKQSDGSFVAGTSVKSKAMGAAPVGIKPKSIAGRELNLDFETGTLADWTAEGNAWEGQPIKGDTVAGRRADMKSNHQGEYWIGGFEKFGDKGTGSLTSAPFLVTHRYATFLANGGDGEKTRVELVRKDTGKAFYQIFGTKRETLRQITVDLNPLIGQEIMIRIVDEHRGGWGHLNFDHFRLHSSKPAEVTPQMIALAADEYPHAGLSAQQAAEAMTLPDGFSVTVGAAEPQVQQPIAMAIDDRGRVWVAEAYEYPIRATGDQGRDRILIFEDTDGDGSLDSRKVFVEGLNLVSGLEVGFGGVWVGAAPYLMFIPDRNGDDQPDSAPQILLDGWGYQDTHETLNTFVWGPDGWLYGCHGVFTHSKVGKPGTPDAERTPLNCAVWRYHPVRHEFDVFANGTSNPWGVDFDDHGQAFITACVIPHLYHIIQGARYQRQGGRHFNPYTYRDIPTIADHLHYLGSTPHSGNSKSDAAGGGHAHAGAMIYLGGKWPQQYRNQLFMNNIHGQRLNMDVLRPNGSGFVGSHGPDFLLTGDQASQILNFRYGPDGNAWMIDWYDMQACHRREADIHDRTNGRIYKIHYGKSETSAPPKSLDSMSDLELAQLTLHENDWYVRHSRRNLQERATMRSMDDSAVAFLNEVLAGNEHDTRRLRAAWALHVISGLTNSNLHSMLSDASPYVRGWAVQLALENAKADPKLLARLVDLAHTDESQVVRLYLASAAQKLPLEQRWDLLTALTGHAEDRDDHNLALMYWYAAEPLTEEDTGRALALAMSAGNNIPLLREFMLRRIGSGGADSSLAALVEGLGEAKSPELQLTFLNAIRAALVGRRQVTAPPQWTTVSAGLLSSDDAAVRLQVIALGVTFGDSAAFAAMRSQVEDNAGDAKTRLVALRSLLDAGDPGLVPTLSSLLESEGPLREASIRGLAQYGDPAVAPALLDAYADFSLNERRLALGTLCGRASSGVALLKAIDVKQVANSELTADLVRQLQFLKSDEIDSLLESVWGTVRESASDKLKLIAEMKTLVASEAHPPADSELGRAIFAKTCMKCHVLYGVGQKVGPDLTGSNRANIDYLLSNIVDPSAVMAKEYMPTIILTDDGRVVNGLVKAEDRNSITLQTSDALIVIPKEEIEVRRESEKSMMPDDQLKQFSPLEVRSLIAYLQGKQQTAMLANPDNAGAIFNGRDLTGWSGTDGLWSVEDGELVGRTEGLKRNEWIVSDLSAEDFHLTLEVKLLDNAGNSGIQFRSKAHDGEVSGYQADIGAGWWGKLYEEHGRALLWSESGEEHVKLGDWNTYEVIANGHHIRTLINGKECVNMEDPMGAHRGIIAFQLHSGGKTEVRFRNLQLEILPTSGSHSEE